MRPARGWIAIARKMAMPTMMRPVKAFQMNNPSKPKPIITSQNLTKVLVSTSMVFLYIKLLRLSLL